VAVTSKLTKAARDAFTKAFRELADAEAAVTETDVQVELESARCQAADEEQDRATLELATKMSGDGFGRLNPFKPFGVANPSRLCKLSDSEEADALIALSARVVIHPKSSPATKMAAAVVARAAKAMKEADAARRRALEKRSVAIHHRDSGLQQAYSVALTNLRSSIKYADYVEKTAHYLNVFPRPPKKVKKPTPAPVS